MTKHTKISKDVSDKIQRDYAIYFVVGITILAAVLRFYHLGYNSLWLDEAATYIHSLTLSGIFDYTTSVDYFNPPTFFLFEFIMIKLAGASEIGMRFFPAVFGVLTIPAAYLMGKEFYDKYTGIVTAIIFAVSPFLIYYSQEARAFSMLLFFCTILMYVFLKASKSNERAEWILFGLVSAAIFMTHFYGVIFVAILAVFALIQFRSNIKPLLTGLGVGILFSLPLIILTTLLYFQRTSLGAPTYGMKGVQVIAGTFIQLLGFTGGYGGVIFLILISMGLIYLLFKIPEKAYLLAWIISATLIVSIVMSSHIPILPRYMIFLMIPFALAVASLFQSIANVTSHSTKNYQLCLLFLLVFCTLGVPFYSIYYTTYAKEDWRGIAENLTENANPGDVIVPLPAYIEMPLTIYYNASEHGTTIYKATNISELQRSMNPDPSHATYYIITYDIVAADPSLEMLSWVETGVPIKSQYGNVLVLKR